MRTDDPLAVEGDSASLDLLFCTRVLGLHSLHYGWWNDGEELSLENLKRAQQRYTDELVRLVPLGARKVLDVGCGTGDIARALAADGHVVTAISPDCALRSSEQEPERSVTYVNTTFEELQIDDTFDLVLMAESQNYLDGATMFSRSRRYLRDGGHLLVSGIFGRADVPSTDLPAFVRTVDRRFVADARRYGFELVSEADITRSVLPTLEFSRLTYERYVVPTIRIASLWLDRRAVIGPLLRLALGRERRSLARIERYYLARFDAQRFARTCRYVTYLFVH